MLNQNQIREILDSNKSLTKSQRRHLKDVIKNRDRRDKHINKQLLEQSQSSKFIEENHNGHDYSNEFTEKATDYYINNYLWNNWVTMCDDPNRFLYCFQKIREKLQTLLLHWPDTYERGSEFYFIMKLLDTYRENKGDGNALLSQTYQYFKSINKFN